DAYESFTNGFELAAALTSDLRDVSHDEHMRVGFSPATIPPFKPGQPPPPEQVERYKREMEKVNCGFSKVEQMPGNVGYVKLDVFALLSVCGATASKA